MGGLSDADCCRKRFRIPSTAVQNQVEATRNVEPGSFAGSSLERNVIISP